jgi:hypothetical protein
MEHYKNQIFYTRNVRDLNDFTHLINFYKSYYSKELKDQEQSQSKDESGKKVPGGKPDMVFLSR